MDSGFSSEQLATAHAFGKMIDENLYWTLVHARWQLKDNRNILNAHFFNQLPFPLKQIVPFIAQRKVSNALYQHGLGRHSDEEIIEIARNDLTALSDFLGDKAYFFKHRWGQQCD